MDTFLQLKKVSEHQQEGGSFEVSVVVGFVVITVGEFPIALRSFRR